MVWAVRARGGVGTHWQPLNLNTLYKHQDNASQVCAVARKRGPGGLWAVGVVRARHALAAFKYSLNIQKMGGGGAEGAGGCGHALAAFKYSLNIQSMQPGVGSGEAGVVWCGGGEGAGGCGHALAAFKYSLNT